MMMKLRLFICAFRMDFRRSVRLELRSRVSGRFIPEKIWLTSDNYGVNYINNTLIT